MCAPGAIKPSSPAKKRLGQTTERKTNRVPGRFHKELLHCVPSPLQKLAKSNARRAAKPCWKKHRNAAAISAKGRSRKASGKAGKCKAKTLLGKTPVLLPAKAMLETPSVGRNAGKTSLQKIKSAICSRRLRRWRSTPTSQLKRPKKKTAVRLLEKGRRRKPQRAMLRAI